eukprot:TRINITY_DN40883_c0_g1_i1.p1 TRINITY_DN40883_c0_g1~~TRINITY_DN40883_c0_g1_i1.p1  ORF type:complete len:382 (-),score=53.92 TRINITY_DN40883_c0_g1_i1:594-1739(-)
MAAAAVVARAHSHTNGTGFDVRPVPKDDAPAQQKAAAATERNRKPEFLLNPLLAVCRKFACAACGRFDPEGAASSEGGWECSKCRSARTSGKGTSEKPYAYVTLLYGTDQGLVLGALALGESLIASETKYERILLHTSDVPYATRSILGVLWKLVEVPYITSAPDLHTEPYERAKFKQIFTKLHIFNPEALPYERVVFLDLDTLVLKNVDQLFGLRTPAAMQNVKDRDGSVRVMIEHGERMDAKSSYFNAGILVVAPSKALFELLRSDVEVPDAQWHGGAWSPEQSYLSKVLAGEFTHISQLYNCEVQLHSGVPQSELWKSALPEEIHVAHFSGSDKVWKAAPDATMKPIASDWVQETFAKMTPSQQTALQRRCCALHTKW